MDRFRLSLIARWAAAALLIVFLLVVAACGSGGALAPAGAPASGGPAAGAPEPAASGAPADPDAGNGGTANGAVFRDLARIIYTGSLSVRVDDLDAAVTAGRAAVLGAGGYVGASRQTTNAEQRTASITYRIPADRWEETLQALRGLGSVLLEQIDSSEVTGQIVDLEARIRNARVSEAAVQAIAEKATTFEDILEGQARLSAIRDEIERLDAQLANLEAQADLGTLTVTYGTESGAVVRAAKDAAWDARGEVARATGTLVDMLQGLASVAIWFGIVWLPVLALLLALAIGVRLVLRRTGAIERLTREPSPPTIPSA